MKKLLIVLILMVIGLQWTFAQESTVYLRNGSIAIGKYAKSRSSDRIRVVTGNGSTIYFTENAIKNIVDGNDVQKTRRPNTDNMEDATVYLRNGSVITGKLDESGERLLIETPNGSKIYFTERSATEIIRNDEELADTETPVAPRRRTETPTTSSRADRERADNTTVPSKDRYEQYAETKQGAVPVIESPYKVSGYQGFLDLGYTIKIGEVSTSRFEISTSHGYQFNPMFFAGIGFGAHFHDTQEAAYTNEAGDSIGTTKLKAIIPIFADFRVNFMEGPLIPYAGLKVGYSMSVISNDYQYDKEDGSGSVKRTETNVDGLGFYLAPSVGIKYMLSRSLSLDFALGYSAQLFDYQWFDETLTLQTKTKNNGGFTLRVGVGF